MKIINWNEKTILRILTAYTSSQELRATKISNNQNIWRLFNTKIHRVDHFDIKSSRNSL